ncbi:four helix bundle protein [Carboxylicivirga sp. N1Y90]
MHDYKDLNVWKDSIDFVVSVYELTKLFPKDEIYALTSQVKKQLFQYLQI